MKSRLVLSFAALVTMVMVTGLACSTSFGAKPTSTPLPSSTPLPTNTPVPPTKVPTQTLTPTPQIFFTEEFDEDTSALWRLELLGPGHERTNKIETSFDNGRMRFDITATDIYAYYFYTSHEYSDVRLDLRAENLGVNSQNISLVCRASDKGWYEFSVGSDGMWYLWAQHDGNYDLLAMGGTVALKQGHAINEYTMICEGDQISMFVNGQETAYSPFKPMIFYYTDGQVGFNVSSLSVYPVITEIDWLKISQP